MKNLIKLLLVTFVIFLLIGCSNDSTPPKPTLQKTNPLEKFDDNWPPKEDNSRSIDMSDLTMDESGISAKQLQEFGNLPKDGNSTIFGKIALRSNTGNFISGSYADVYIIPKTSYSKEWFSKNYISGNFDINLDSRVYDFIKFTKSNQRGDFSFSDMPKGKYYIIGVMNCSYECGFDSNKSIRMGSEIVVDRDGSVLKNIIKSL